VGWLVQIFFVVFSAACSDSILIFRPPDSFVPLPSGSVITTVDAKKSKVKKGETQKYGFMIRFMQMTRFIERCVHPIPWALFFRVPLEVVRVQTGGARST
jgi:hypothetical protein